MKNLLKDSAPIARAAAITLILFIFAVFVYIGYLRILPLAVEQIGLSHGR